MIGKEFMLRKRGELTTQQIVILIILIASFTVILFFLFRLNLTKETQQEICHNSVVLKGQSNFAGELDCRTNYVCISGGEECSDLIPTETIKVNLNQNDEKIKNETMNAITNQMDECWWMFGEGKIDYVGYSWKPDVFVGTHCAVCSVIKFDDSIGEIIPQFSINGTNIDTNEKYSVITGMRGEGEYISPTIIQADDIISLGCTFDITKA